jgi:hypothetical protein
MNAVQYSFRLGWRFAQLYHDPHRASEDASDSTARPPVHLPGVSELSASERTALLLGEITHDVDSLSDTYSMPAVKTSMTTMSGVMTGTIDRAGKQTQILATYTLLRLSLGAADAHSGTALDLGRMLADTVLLATEPADYVREFGQYRLANSYGWLEDLHTSFPTHAADTVKGSMQVWQAWIHDHNGTAPAGQAEHLKRALDLQGERWRRILSGEILADDLLSADDYRAAAADLFSRLRGLAGSFARRFWPVIGIISAATGAIIWAIVTFAAAGVTTIVALIATAAGSLGVSWKTIGATLGKVASKAEGPLWDAELIESLVIAATIPPQEMNRKSMSAMRKKADSLTLEPAPPPAALPASAQSAPAQSASAPSASGESAPAGPASGESAPAGPASGEPAAPETATTEPGPPAGQPGPAVPAAAD